ncbi:MAG: MBL fold metallo-hydrolase [Candidatus Melainabacteria bacterium]|nr:MAG: MBL fold metallo-hydrolase [Candidatus Melainabacteria bacterium]
MFFKQFYLGCLAHGSYLIGSVGEAAVIDPQRDVDQYIEEANREGFSIKYIIETHLHADFVSGHRELAEKTGAAIVFGAKAGAAFPHIAAKDGDVLKVGTINLSILETPGHTPESICILAKDTADEKPAKLFSGDTLFIGDVGRPDLVGSKGFSANEMAGLMYDSLHEKLLKLPDEVELFPAHGAGSLCGKHLSNERSSTIGSQKQFNYALKPMTKEAFIEMLTTDQPEVPAYFPKDVEINRQGASPLNNLPRPLPLIAAAVATELQRGAIVLDIRSATEYASGHIKGSLNIGLGGQFASWAGTLIELGTPIILLANDLDQVDEAVMRLARVGFESVLGYVENGLSSSNESGLEIAQSSVISVDELKRALDANEELLVLDVRRPGEYEAGHVPNAINIPLSELPASISDIPGDCPLAIICASGYRSSIAKSVLERGNSRLSMNVLGGTAAWKNAGYVVEQKETATSKISS